MKRISPYAKAVAAAAGALGIALVDGHLTAVELCAVVGTVAGVFIIPNTPEEE